MIIGVLSDTHMPRSGKKLPHALVKAFRGVDLILHLGDWMTMDAYDQLAAIAPVDGIAGNNDPDEIVKKFGMRKILKLGSCHIGLVHGHQPLGSRAAETKAFHAFQTENVDAILFGHSHSPLLKEKDGIILFNPGSAMDKRRESRYSAGILELDKTRLKARHIYYDSKL